jgi:hypothetical protein
VLLLLRSLANSSEAQRTSGLVRECSVQSMRLLDVVGRDSLVLELHTLSATMVLVEAPN